ncbi:Glycoside hydrolase [Phytophthora palmivora]|uniref:Glycoside hydrolase n=1 Tax=Phytophthora palmivora TaxID=4796 RepID=A0A2P4Y254_9STRA|nr:Glycoside hydrolase [Phytophthora palmivora]
MLVSALTAVCLADNLDKYGVFTPKKIALGPVPSMDGKTYSGEFTLSVDEPLATLDYDYEVAGLPYFVVSAISNGPVEVEVKYAEQFPALSLNYSDGPSQFTTSIANSRRVETHRFTGSEIGATITSMLSQPGERWQTLRLLTGDSITFETVGLQASVEVIDDLTTLPGKFSSSNPKYDEIWKLGVRAVTAACVDADSQAPSWSSSEENGTFVPGTRPGISYRTWNLTDYVLRFESQIIRGGAGYTIAYDLAGNRDGVQIHLASEYPSDTTYSNINTTLFPANTATLAYGYDFANATSMTSYILGQYDVPFSVKENVWYLVEIRVNSTAGNIAFSVDGQQVFDIVLMDMGFTDDQLSFYGWASRGEGAIGFGGWQDQASFVRNVTVTNLTDASEVLYSNPMTDESVVVPEFGGQTNAYGVCLDGAKRDRYIWLGDFYHTTRIMGVANSKPEQIEGTWKFMLEYQGDNGQFPGFVPISYQSPMPTPDAFLYDAGKVDAYYNFPDYVILGMIGLVSYMDYYNDIAFVQANWEEFTHAMSWLVSCQGSNGLIDLTKYVVVFLGPGAGMAVNAAAVQCLDGMAKVARAVGDWESATTWIEVAASVKAAINELLWNDTLGNYAVDVSTPEVYGVSATAFAITSGVANDTQIKLCVEGLEGLRQGPGYLDTSDTDNTTRISPNTNGFLLDALLQHGYTSQAEFLLNNLWDAMISDENYRSGASWEYVSQSLEPGYDLFTSLSHPWGGAPTYALTNYVAGIRPLEFGFRRWIVNPLVSGLSVTSANATVSTPFGDLSTAWELADSQLSVTITAPVGTDGILEVAQPTGIYEQHITGTGDVTTITVQQ